jgi:hypothetical protein
VQCQAIWTPCNMELFPSGTFSWCVTRARNTYAWSHSSLVSTQQPNGFTSLQSRYNPYTLPIIRRAIRRYASRVNKKGRQLHLITHSRSTTTESASLFERIKTSLQLGVNLCGVLLQTFAIRPRKDSFGESKGYHSFAVSVFCEDHVARKKKTSRRIFLE